MADVKWIKIATDIFDNNKIKIIEAMPEGDALIVIWFKILMLAGDTNDSGLVYFANNIPYNDISLSTIFNKPIALIKLALSTFEQFGMIEIVDDFIHVSNWEKYQNVDGMERIREQTRNRVAKYRETKKLECNVTGNVTSNDNVTHCNEIEEEIDKEIDKDKEKDIKEKEIPKGISKKKGENIPPTIDEIREYCIERNNGIDAEYFYHFYEEKGWIVGKSKMKNWHSAIITWEKRNKETVVKNNVEVKQNALVNRLRNFSAQEDK